MNIYIKIAFIILFTGLGSIIGWQKSNSIINPTEYETVLFATVLSSDAQSSIEEKETASHFFSEAILGWTLSPAFKQSLSFDISSRKQERGNIIFRFISPSQTLAQDRATTFISVLRAKLKQYNTVAKTQFNILFDPPITTEKSPHKSFWTIGGAISGFFLGLFFLELALFLRKEKKEENKQK